MNLLGGTSPSVDTWATVLPMQASPVVPRSTHLSHQQRETTVKERHLVDTRSEIGTGVAVLVGSVIVREKERKSIPAEAGSEVGREGRAGIEAAVGIALRRASASGTATGPGETGGLVGVEGVAGAADVDRTTYQLSTARIGRWRRGWGYNGPTVGTLLGQDVSVFA